VKFGLIGFGAWGRHHAQAICQAPGAELAAIATSSPETAATAREAYPNIEVFPDYRSLLGRADVEAVDIVVPNYLHSEIGVAALEAGKNVLLEKPMATTAEECDRLIAARTRNGKLLTIAHDYRTAKQYVRTKELLDADALGEPMYVNITLFRNRFRDGSQGWRFSPERVGSWILEEPVHFFDLILWYMDCYGDPVSVQAISNSNGRPNGLYDNLTCIVRYPSGAYGVINQTLGGFQHHTQVQVVGREGAVRTFWSGAMDRDQNPSIGFQVRTRDLVFERGVRECEEIPMQKDSEGAKLQNQINRVVKAFAEGHEPTPGEEARKRVIICNAADQSIRDGKPIDLAF
jgi:myo-inositol 2-dehydrogenase / D-chiro-inositol 1-dehydrogenase